MHYYINLFTNKETEIKRRIKERDLQSIKKPIIILNP